MPNLLLTASAWTDEAGGNPPSYWDGTTYEFLSAYAATAPSMTATASAGDTVGIDLMVNSASTRGTTMHVAVNGTDVYTNDLQTVGDATFASDPLAAGDVVLIKFTSSTGFSAYDLDVSLTPAPDPPTHNCDCDDTTNNRTLKQLRDDLMRRLGFGAQVNNPPPGMADLLNSFLVQAQEFLYRRYDVLRTERFYSWQLQTGVRMYDIDANDETCTKRLDPRKVTWVGVIRDDQWLPLICGIPPTIYSGNQTGCPQRYEIRQCIEVWPVPDETAGSLVVKGRFGLEAFAADTDKTTIDDQLVFALALANAKAHYRQPDANNYIAQMEAMMRNLVAGSHHTRRYVPGDDGRSDYVYVRPKPSEPFPT